jgi:hypothetical protein
VAEQLGRALGKDLEVVDIPPARQSDALVDAGFLRPVADAVAEMFAAFNAGLITPQGDRRLVGATTIEETIRQYVPGGAMSVVLSS